MDPEKKSTEAKLTKEDILKTFEAEWPKIDRLFPENIREKIKTYTKKKLAGSNPKKDIDLDWIKNLIIKRLYEAISTVYEKEKMPLNFFELKELTDKARVIINPTKPVTSKK